ncbi:methionyl-tRNA formyltransferase [Microscilla marina]|uniref:Methionyl-tRNA formyltransferase n=1 Tax=Microscilla marina ATCC 23134 TaxID=313606 RepID=A1ZSV1_MICM2|nr:methionyl-tRNA formyltransferase [Microscilla marina]EAY26515.1 methionyl-tRNA formyltransferase [Microscilla marina ATCC 23134]
MRIIFLGTPDFAVPSLKVLVDNGFNVVAVVTATDKRAGRGNKIKTSAVKDFALEHNIPVLQPERLKAPEFIEELASYQADLQIVVAFRMLPEAVWNMPSLGTFNLHASLLPDYRGAAPINWAIINGEKETGVTTFFLKQKIDTGNIIFQEKAPILPEDNIGTMYEKLKNIGGGLVLKTVRAIQAGKYPQTAQDLSKETPPAPKIFRETCEIDWNKTSEQVHNLVRGLAPIPAAWTMLSGKNCKIYKTSLATPQLPEGVEAKQPGEYVTDNKKYLYFKTGDGFIAVEDLKLEGKKRMDVKSFLSGNKLD